MKQRAVPELETGTIVVPKRISLLVAGGIVVAVTGWIIHYATDRAAANARFERLERDVAIVSQVNERTIKMERDLEWVRAAVERMAKR